MKWPPPFRSLPNPKEVWAWGMFDLANQSFTLLIITVLFPLYFKKVAVGDDAKGDALWSAGISLSLFIVVALSPLVGSAADSHKARKKFLVISGIGCVLFTGMLSLIAPGSGWIGLLIFIPANILYQLGENLLASFLPSLSTTRTIGKISAIGWTMGYIGGLMLLILVSILAFGLGWSSPDQWRPIFIMAAIWFALGMIPATFILKEPVTHELEDNHAPALTRLKNTLKHAYKQRELFRFLVAFLVYGFGVQTMIAFAAILAQDFGIQDNRLILFTLQLTITAGITAFVVAKYQDRIGVKITIASFLVVWILSCGSMLIVKSLIPVDPPEWIFWVIGNGIGIGLGGIGTSSRTIVGMFAPKHRTAEFYGLWGMTYKLAGAIGVLSFGQIKAWVGDIAALGVLTGFFVVGLILLLRVRVIPGIRAARMTEKLEIKTK
ncbi:MAG: MFS transporter [Phycisphaerales bacterium]|jgi:UMF1 family MFS transporter|nr:MFS transporter [Phycisphaerales bacterium]